MMEATTLGVTGLVILVVLIAIRMPIAYAMILVGGGGVFILNGPALLLNQLKTLAYGQFSIYDLSVVPMFVLMGAHRVEGRPQPGAVPRRERVARLDAGRHRDGGDRGLRGVRRGLRLVARHRLDHGQGRPARAQALQLLRRAGDRIAGGGRRAGHPDPALGRADHLRHHRRGEHRHDVHGGDDPRPAGGRAVPADHRDLRRDLARGGTPRRILRPGGVRRRHHRCDPRAGDLRPRAGWHLRWLLQPDARGCGRRLPRLDLRHLAAHRPDAANWSRR